MLAREYGYPDYQKVRASVVKSLQSLARKNRRSMEQEVRELSEEYVVDRSSILEQIEAGWMTQSRRLAAKGVGVGRK